MEHSALLRLKHIKLFSFFLFFFFLAFSQALTINIKFPLKFSEIGIFIFLAYFLIKAIYDKNVIIRKDSLLYVMAIYIAVVLTSIFVNFFKEYNYELNLADVRISKNLDSILKFIYLIFAFIAMQMTVIAAKTYGTERILKWFFWGSLLAALYSWYLFISSALHLPVFFLPGMDAVPQSLTVSFGKIIRCGTFKEGNYMGLFLLVSGFLARYQKRVQLSNFYFASILTTFSTISFVCVIIFFFFSNLSNNKSIFKAIAGLVVIVAILTTLAINSQDFRSNVINKIFASADEVENPNDVYSRLDRLNTTQIGLNIFANNPILGIGMANFGVHFDHFNILPEFGRGDYKRTCNNVYIEILCESGIFAFILFIVMASIIIKRSRKIKSKPLIIGNIICFLYLVAFPTYTILFMWFFWGIIIADSRTTSKSLVAAA